MPSQPNTLVRTAVRVHLTVKYVATSTLCFSTIHRGQKTRPHPHRRLVGTNILQMRKVSGLQIQDMNAGHSSVKEPYAYAQESIPATHHDIATPDIARQWKHFKVIVDKISYQPQIGIGMLIGRNIPTAFQPLKVIYGNISLHGRLLDQSVWTRLHLMNLPLKHH